MSLESALDLAKREIVTLCEVAVRKLRDGGVDVDPPEKTSGPIIDRIERERMHNQQRDAT